MTEVAKPCINVLILKWYLLHTRTRWEKKVDDLLQEQGFQSYCPVFKTKRKWSDRYKIIKEPVFKGFVFVKIEEKNRIPVRMTAGVINFVAHNGKPVIFKEKDICRLQKFLNENPEVSNSEILSDDKVKEQLQNKLKNLSIPFIFYCSKAVEEETKFMELNIQTV